MTKLDNLFLTIISLSDESLIVVKFWNRTTGIHGNANFCQIGITGGPLGKDSNNVRNKRFGSINSPILSLDLSEISSFMAGASEVML
jgi:hypothetical protein